MNHEQKPYTNLAEWVPLSKVVDYMAIDDYDDAGVMRKRFFNWAVRGYRRLRLNILREVKRAYVRVSPFGTIAFPDDCKKVISVSYYDGCGELFSSNEVALIEVAQDKKCTCEKCKCTHQLCDAVSYEHIQEPCVINGFSYVNDIYRRFDKTTGNYIEQRVEFVLNAENSQIVQQTNERVLCTLDIEDCGCVSETEHNIECLRRCCCNMLDYFAANSPYWKRQHVCADEGFAVDEENRIIYVSMEGVRHAVVKYYADLPIINGQVYVPAVSVETLAAWGLYKRDRRRNIAQAQKDGSYMHYKRERKEMIKNLIPIKGDLIRNLSNLVPHG